MGSDNIVPRVSEEGVHDDGFLSQVLLLILRVICHRRLILLSTLGVFLLSVICVLLMENTYRSNAVLLVSANSSSSGLSSLAKLAGGDLAGMLTMSSGSYEEEVTVVFGSEELAIRTIQQFRLDTAWKFNETNSKKRELLFKKWNAQFQLASGQNGELNASFEDVDPLRSQYVLNAYIARVDSAWQSLKRREASEKVRFAQARLQERMQLLNARTDSLIQFQIENRAFLPDEQIRQTIINVAQIESRKAELNASRDYEIATDRPSEAARLGKYAGILDGQMKGLMSNEAKSSQSNSILMNLPKAMNIAKVYAKKIRLIQLDIAVVEGLSRQVEQMSIEKMRDVPVLQVVDSPKIPTRKFSPPRSVLVIIFTMITFLISVSAAFLIESIKESSAHQLILLRIKNAWKA